MKLLIIGGVAGGGSAAARARRLSEKAHIIVFESLARRLLCQLRPSLLCRRRDRPPGQAARYYSGTPAICDSTWTCAYALR